MPRRRARARCRQRDRHMHTHCVAGPASQRAQRDAVGAEASELVGMTVQKLECQLGVRRVVLAAARGEGVPVARERQRLRRKSSCLVMTRTTKNRSNLRLQPCEG
jgi:hypothetical protein